MFTSEVKKWNLPFSLFEHNFTFHTFPCRDFKVLIDSFSFRTGPSDEQLDPVEWRLEASNDQNTWKVLHSQAPTAGKSRALQNGFSIQPKEAPALISHYFSISR